LAVSFPFLIWFRRGRP